MIKFQIFVEENAFYVHFIKQTIEKVLKLSISFYENHNLRVFYVAIYEANLPSPSSLSCPLL